MIFLSRKLIYLHVQKTGGNSVSTALLPYSDDEMTTRLHQDAVDRFGVSGEFTRRKHAKLVDYQQSLGPALNDFKIVLPVRDPMERAISFYFSPQRWMEERDGIWHHAPPRWDVDLFRDIISRAFTLSEFVEIDGRVRLPDHVIRFSHLADDFGALCAAYGFPLGRWDLPTVNRSVASTDLRERATRDPQAIAAVRERFAADYDLIARLGI